MRNKQRLSVSQAARKAGYTTKYIYDLLWSGRLPAQKQDGRWLIAEADVEKLPKMIAKAEV